MQRDTVAGPRGSQRRVMRVNNQIRKPSRARRRLLTYTPRPQKWRRLPTSNKANPGVADADIRRHSRVYGASLAGRYRQYRRTKMF